MANEIAFGLCVLLTSSSAARQDAPFFHLIGEPQSDAAAKQIPELYQVPRLCAVRLHDVDMYTVGPATAFDRTDMHRPHFWKWLRAALALKTEVIERVSWLF
jgi:hypothetical protein